MSIAQRINEFEKQLNQARDSVQVSVNISISVDTNSDGGWLLIVSAFGNPIYRAEDLHPEEAGALVDGILQKACPPK